MFTLTANRGLTASSTTGANNSVAIHTDNQERKNIQHLHHDNQGVTITLNSSKTVYTMSTNKNKTPNILTMKRKKGQTHIIFAMTTQSGKTLITMTTNSGRTHSILTVTNSLGKIHSFTITTDRHKPRGIPDTSDCSKR